MVLCVSLWDTAGQEDYDRLRPLSYPGTDVFLVCYSVINRTSFSNTKTKWFPEIAHHCPTHTILVGTKTDLREDPEKLETLRDMGMTPVSTEEGQILAMEFGSIAAMECSALKGRGVKEIFEAALKEVVCRKDMKPLKKKKKNCTLL